MAQTVKLKRSATASAVPTTAQLALGELAINTYDGKLFLKKNVSGVETVVEVGGGATGASVTVSTTAPSTPAAGDLWWNSTEGRLKIYYNDGNTSQWVDASITAAGPNFGTGVEAALGYAVNSANGLPTLDANQNVSIAGSLAMGTSFIRNRFINPSMEIWQRGTSSFSTNNTNTYTADRWWGFSGTSTAGTFSLVSSTGLTGFPYAVRAQRTAANTGVAGVYLGQIIETLNCTGLAGNTIAVSFYARAGTNYSPTSSILGVQMFTGTGSDQGLASMLISTWTGQASTTQNVTLTTSWQRFTVTFSVPAGTTELAIAFRATSTGTAGTNDYFDVTGAQLELGNVATPFERRSFTHEIILAQRYYWAQTLYVAALVSGNAVTGTKYPATMRIAPTVGGGGAGFTTVTASTDGAYYYQTTTNAQNLTFNSEL